MISDPTTVLEDIQKMIRMKRKKDKEKEGGKKEGKERGKEGGREGRRIGNQKDANQTNPTDEEAMKPLGHRKRERVLDSLRFNVPTHSRTHSITHPEILTHSLMIPPSPLPIPRLQAQGYVGIWKENKQEMEAFRVELMKYIPQLKAKGALPQIEKWEERMEGGRERGRKEGELVKLS